MRKVEYINSAAYVRQKVYWPDRKAFSRTVPRTPTRLQVHV